MFSHGKAAMTPRNVEARIVKLETQRQRSNEILLVWRMPGQEVTMAVVAFEAERPDRKSVV